MSRKKFIDLTGKRFGRWLVLEKTSIRLNGFVCYLCLCDCGTKRIERSINIKQNSSCGCLQKEIVSTRGRLNYKLLHTSENWIKSGETRRIYAKQCANFLYDIVNTYKLSPKDWTQLILRSNGKCEMCKINFKNARSLCIDHNHKTGKVRGLICIRCNIALQLLDNPNLLSLAKDYLKLYDLQYNNEENKYGNETSSIK